MIECQCRRRLVVCLSLSLSLSLSPVTTTGVPYRFLLTTQSHAWCRHVCSTLSHDTCHRPARATARTGSRRGNGRSVERVTNIETAAWSSSSSIQTTNGRESVFCLLILLATLPTLQYIPYLGIGAAHSSIDTDFTARSTESPHHRHRQGADIAC